MPRKQKRKSYKRGGKSKGPSEGCALPKGAGEQGLHWSQSGADWLKGEVLHAEITEGLGVQSLGVVGPQSPG